MRRDESRRGGLRACATFVLLLSAHAEIIDRIAVSVGNSVVTTADVDREIRVTAFINGVAPDFSAANKRTTADRLIEQKLIERELEMSKYPLPDAAAAVPLYADLMKMRGARSLAEYGITEQQVKDALFWQLTLLRFIEVRFQPGVQVTDRDIQDYFDKVVKPAAQAEHPNQPVALEDYRDKIETTLTGQRTDKEVDNWLREARKQTEVVFHDEVFR